MGSNRFILKMVWCFFLIAILFTSSVYGFKAPVYKGPVTDLTGTLSKQEVQAIEQKILDYHDSTTNEIGVLIIQALDGVPKEDYGHDVFNAWGIGKKGKDNGVLFLIAMDEHETRIEVGYGLDGEFTDLEANRLQDRKNSEMSKKFRTDDFAGGINVVVDGIIIAIGGEYDPPVTEEESSPLSIIILIIIILFVLLIIFAALAEGIDLGGGGFSGGGYSGGTGGGGGGGGFTFSGGSCGGGGGGGGW